MAQSEHPTRVVSNKDGTYQGQCDCGYMTDRYFLDTTARRDAYEHGRSYAGEVAAQPLDLA